MNIVDQFVAFCRERTDQFIFENGHDNETLWIVLHPETYNALLRDWDPMRQMSFGYPPARAGNFLRNDLTGNRYRIGIFEFIVSDKPEVTSGIPWPECLRTGLTSGNVISVNT